MSGSTGTSTGPTPAVEVQGRSSWAGVVSLGLGIFAITMAEFLPAGLLPRISADLDVPVGAAGQAVSVTALTAAVSALSISVVLPRADRRRVVIGLTVLAAVSNVVVALAPNLVSLLLARVLLGVALGGFWAMAMAMAARLVHADHVGRALTVINSGVSLATVAAVPFGTWLGEAWGWRAVFLLAAAVAVIALVAQTATLPRVDPTAASGVRALGAVLRSGVVLAGLVAALLIFSGHFSGFTYIRPAATSVSGIDAGTFAVLLLVFGLALFLGTGLSGPLADRAPRVGVLLFPGLIGLGMLMLLGAGGTLLGLFTAAAVWGFGFGGVPTTLMTWGARTEPTRLEQIGGLLVTVASIGVAAGAVTGGLLVERATASTPLLVGGIAALAGGSLLGSLERRSQP